MSDSKVDVGARIFTQEELLYTLLNLDSVTSFYYQGLEFDIKRAGPGELSLIVFDGIGTLGFTQDLHSVLSAIRDIQFLTHIYAS